MKFKINNQGKDYDVEITEPPGNVKISVNGKDFTFAAETQAAAVLSAVPQTIIPKRDLSSKEVRAVLAGTISELSVKPGDIVKLGQKILTLSAMKMENEILAECEGKVKEVKIEKDQKVKEGDVLITLV